MSGRDVRRRELGSEHRPHPLNGIASGKEDMAAKKRARTSRGTKGIDDDGVRAIALGFPGVEEGTSYGTPAFRVAKKLFARFHQGGEAVVVRCEPDLRDALMAAKPHAFFQTDHYAGHAWVLVRKSTVARADLEEVLEEAWRSRASRKHIAQWDGEDD